MAKHALLIASATDGLLGPVPDAKRVAGLVEKRDFKVRKCVGQDATRKGILAAYRALIDDAGGGDAVVIYYSGHGARSLDKEYKPADEHASEKRYHHFIVPMDLHESSEDDFRGILSLELSSLLGQLTDKTKNVTVIFDCCHSGGMTRDMQLRPKSLPKSWYTGASEHFERFKKGELEGFPAGQIDVVGNPNAVRLMAALPSQQAWEYDGPDGAFGLLTNGLITAFEESGDRPVSWDVINRRVRELVQRREPGQYPDIEGPSSRFVFGLEEANLTGIVPAESSEEGPRLQAGRLMGIDVGDEYVIMPQGSLKVEREHMIADATVTYVGGAWSLVNVEPSEAGTDLPAGAQAFPASRAQHKQPVIVKAGAELGPALQAKITESGFLRMASQGEDESSPGMLAVAQDDGLVHVRRSGLDVVAPLAVDGDAVATVVEGLTRLAREHKLETLESGSGGSALKAEYELEWGRVVGGEPRALSTSGAVLYSGDRIFVRLRNKSVGSLYVSVFDVGLAGKITLLTRNMAPSGVEVQAGGPAFTLGYREPFGWRGLGPLQWPEEVPRDGEPRPESLAIIVSDRPQNLRALESPGMASPKSAEPTRTELERIVDQAATGRTRDVGAEESPPDVHYAVEHIHFLVDPTESTVPVTEATVGRSRAAEGERGMGESTRGEAGQPMVIPTAAVIDEAPFLIDDRPDPSAAYRRARGATPPAAVALRLGEVVVHSNRALLGSADVRVDALVVTGGDQAEGGYRAGTTRFPRIKDGDRLPLDKMQVYFGPANGFLDVAVWVSRDAKGSLELMDMLKEQVNASEFQKAALVLAGLAVAAPAAGAIIAGMGAATVVANVAYRLLSAAAGQSIGLYRTSLLANEQFGVGRHPVNGMMRAQDFSFWYEVSEIEHP